MLLGLKGRIDSPPRHADKARSNSERPGVARVLHRMACPGSLSLGASTRERGCLSATPDLRQKQLPLRVQRTPFRVERVAITLARALSNCAHGAMMAAREPFKGQCNAWNPARRASMAR